MKAETSRHVKPVTDQRLAA